jgi:hypothetical protein
MPQRIQRKRTKGWTMPEGAVYVGRPTRWGNPFKLSTAACDCGSEGLCEHVAYRCHSAEAAVRYFRADLQGLMKVAIRTELRGKDLACWCPLDEPCHADVLLEIANK